MMPSIPAHILREVRGPLLAPCEVEQITVDAQVVGVHETPSRLDVSTPNLFDQPRVCRRHLPGNGRSWERGIIQVHVHPLRATHRYRRRDCRSSLLLQMQHRPDLLGFSWASAIGLPPWHGKRHGGGSSGAKLLEGKPGVRGSGTPVIRRHSPTRGQSGANSVYHVPKLL
jgi:hypothetical protein